MLDTQKEIKYKIIKSKKYKRITISIKRSQKIIVSAPKSVSNKKINEFVEKNKLWIKTNIDRLELDVKTKKHTFLNGDSFLLEGIPFTLNFIEVVDDKFSKLKNIIDNITIDNDKKEIKIIISNKINHSQRPEIIAAFYKNKTKKIIEDKFEKNTFFNQNKSRIKNIKIQKSNGRWGSCSKINNINFSSRLAMLPSSCIDYVIYHELAHITEKNHGKSFYTKLETLCPNYKTFENEIKKIEKNNNVSLA